VFKWSLQYSPYRQNLCYKFLIQNGLKKGDALLTLLFNFALDYAIRRVQETQRELKLNGTHYLLADNVNKGGENTDTLQKTQKLYQELVRWLVRK
jgi:hypothetical protein